MKQNDLFTKGVAEENEKLLMIRQPPFDRGTCRDARPALRGTSSVLRLRDLPRYQLDGIFHDEICPYSIHSGRRQLWPPSAQKIEDRLTDIIQRCAEFEKTCSCGVTIYFLRHHDADASRNLIPYQIDGINHFATCLDAKRYRRRR